MPQWEMLNAADRDFIEGKATLHYPLFLPEGKTGLSNSGPKAENGCWVSYGPAEGGFKGRGQVGYD